MDAKTVLTILIGAGLTIIAIKMYSTSALPQELCLPGVPTIIQTTGNAISYKIGISCTNGKKYVCTVILGIPTCKEVNGWKYIAKYGPYGEITYQDIEIIH